MLLVPVFVLLLARAVLLPGRRLRPVQVGLIELACCLLVYVTVLLAH